ncbi:MAG: TonB-dependent receptor domain-containing protein, partial [Phenylobacterium sp.]
INAFPGNILRTDPVTRALVPGWAIPAGQNGVGLKPTDFVLGTVNLQNQRLGEDILPKQTLNALYVSADQALGDRLELTADARFSSRRFKSHQGAATSTFTVDRNNPFYVSPIGAASESIAYAFNSDLPNPLAAGSVENLSLTAGGSLKLAGDWRSEAYATFAQDIEEVRNSQLLNSVFLNEATGRSADRADTAFRAARDGYFNPFTGIAGSNNPAVLAYIGSGFITARSRDRVASANLQADGSLWSLPAGAVKLALGVQARRETLVRHASNYVASAVPVAQPGTDVSRDVTAAFAELSAPLVGPANARPGLQRLELSIAGRVEHYEAIGPTANPKVGLEWSPTLDLQLRGTYGRSFRAPALRETNDPSVYSPSLLAVGDGSVLSLILGGGNPDLKPETARSWTFGADYRPSRWPGLHISATGFDIRFHNRIDRPVQTNLVNALTDPTLASFVNRISPGANSADRALIAALLASPALDTRSGVFEPEAYGAIADNRYVNTAALHVKGMDVAADYAFALGDDRVVLAGQATYLFAFDQQVTPTSPVIDRANIANYPVRFRSRVTADWTRDRLTLGGAFNYVGRYHDALGVRIGGQPTFDVQARLAPPTAGPLKGVAVLLNIRNLFDRDPPFYDNPVGIGYDAANADPIGRFVSLQLARTW